MRGLNKKWAKMFAMFIETLLICFVTFGQLSPHQKFEDSVTCGHVTCQQKKKKTIMEVSELSHINKPFSLFLSSWPGTTIDNLWLLFLCLIMTNLFSIKAVFRTSRKRQRDDVFSLFSTTRQVSVLTTLDNLSLRGHGVLGKVLHCRLGSIPALLICVFPPPTGLRL